MFSIPCPTPGGPSDKRNIADSYKNNLSLPPDPLFPDLTIHSHLFFCPLNQSQLLGLFSAYKTCLLILWLQHSSFLSSHSQKRGSPGPNSELDSSWRRPLPGQLQGKGFSVCSLTLSRS